MQCPSCQNQFEGLYCNQCGEKVVHDNDFALLTLFQKAFGAITNLDSKLYRTLHLLFFKPGELSKKYVNGSRTPYMGPFQLFIIANLIFFIFLPSLDIFYVPSQWYFSDSFDGINVMAIVEAMVVDKSYTYEQISAMYDAKASSYAKGLVIILLPFTALGMLLLNISKKYALGKHVVFVSHYFSFFLFIMVVWSYLGRLLFQINNKWIYIIPIGIACWIYLTVSIRRFYQDAMYIAVIKSIFAFAIINISIFFYRHFMSLYVLKSLG